MVLGMILTLLWQWIDVAVGESILWRDFDNYCDSGLTWTGVRSSFGMLFDSYCGSDWAWFAQLLSHWIDMGKMPDGFLAWLYIATQWTDTERGKMVSWHDCTCCYTVNWHRGEMVSRHDCTLLHSELTQTEVRWFYGMIVPVVTQWIDTEMRWFPGMTVHCYTVNWHRQRWDGFLAWLYLLLHSELTQRWDGFLAWLYLLLHSELTQRWDGFIAWLYIVTQ